MTLESPLSSRCAVLLAALLAGAASHAADVTWDGSESGDWGTGLNWDNDLGPDEGDYAYITFGTVDFTSVTGTSTNLKGLRLLGATLNLSGGSLKATQWSGAESHVDGTINHSGGTAKINELEIGRNPGGTGAYFLSGGDLDVSRGLNGNSLYLGGNRRATDAGSGRFEISGGSLITRSGVKLGDAALTGTGHFAVLGSAISEIGIAASGDDNDGTWHQHAGSTLTVGIDFGGVTPIFLQDNAAATGGTSATFENGALLDVDYFDDGNGGGTWTVLEVENGDVTDNGLTLAPGVDTSVWSLSVDNSGANGLLKVTAAGEPAGIALTVGDTKKQMMRFGMDYERLWYWTTSMNASEKDTVAKWSVVDCDVDYVRVAINSGYELTEGTYDLTAYTKKIIPMMQDMKDANPDIKFFASPRPLNEAYPKPNSVSWQPYPIWITGASSTTSGSFDFHDIKCAEYLVRYLLLMKSYGFKISFLDVTNEWQSNVSGGRVTQSDVRDISQYFEDYLESPWAHPDLPGLFLAADDIPQIIAPSAWSFEQGSSWIDNLNTQEKKDAVDIAACHNTNKTGTAVDFATSVQTLLGSETEIWNSELHGWKSTDGADEVLTSSFMFEAIRAGFSGINGWLAIGTTNQGHCYILNPSGNPSRNVKYFIFKKLSTTSNYGNALDVNQPGELTSTAALIRGNLMTVWVINSSASSVPVRITPTGRTLSETTVKRTRWSTSLAVEGVTDHIPTTANTSVWASIAGDSLYCFEILLDPLDFPLVKIEAEDFDAKSGMNTESCGDVGGTLNLANMDHGNWSRYDNIAPGSDGVMRFRVARPSGRPDGWIEVRLDDPNGPLIGKVAVPETGDWQVYETIETTLDPVVGTHSIYLNYVEVGSSTGRAMFNLNWFSLTLPQAPEGLAATTVSATEIDLTWDAVVGATGYNLKRATVGGGPYTTVASALGATSYSDSGLSPGTEYHYVIAAIYLGLGLFDSSEVIAFARPLAPTGLTATIASASQIDVSWDSVAGASSYNLKRSTTSGGPYTTVDSGLTSTASSDTGLSPGVRYFYVASAVNPGGEGADSAETSGIPSDPIVPDDVVIDSLAMVDDGIGGRDVLLVYKKSGLGHLHQVVGTGDLANPDWQPVSEIIPGNGGQLDITFPIDPNLERFFYRVAVWRQ